MNSCVSPGFPLEQDSFCSTEPYKNRLNGLVPRGDFFSPELEFQLLDENDPSSSMGIFALEDLAQQEMLMVIPQSCLLTSGGSFETCNMARNLVKQRLLKNKSKFAQYVNHLFDPKH